MPRLVLSSAAGGRVDLTHQAIAGRPIMLWLLARAPTARDLAAFTALEPELRDAESRGFIIVSAAELPREDVATAVLLDARGDVLPAFGGKECMVIIDPGGRIAAVRPREALGEVIDFCRRLYTDGPQDVVQRHAPVLLVEQVLEPALCRQLIEYWEAGEKIADGVASTDHGNQYGDARLKKRRDVALADQDLFRTVKDRLARRLIAEIRRAFQVPVTNFEALRIGCYESSERGRFRRHRDNSTKYTAHRQFALSLNLNDGYEGGQVQFPEFGRSLYRPGAGGAVVFSCSLLHEALPVTAGRRFALFTFLYDDAGAAQERKIIAEEQAAGREGVKVRA